MRGTQQNQESSDDEEFLNVPPISRGLLNYRQLVDYDEHRKSLITWLSTQGKEPEKNKGYAPSTVTNYAHRLDKFYRWVWERSGRYTTQITHAHADNYMELFAIDELRKENGSPYSGNHKRKTGNAIERLFEWRTHELGGEPWSPDVKFAEKTHNQADAFTKAERQKLREAALEYDSIPKYNDLSTEERDRWKSHLAQKLGKPKTEIAPSDWDRMNRSWKIPSLTYTSLDVGFRPVGVHRAETGWLRLEKGVMLVPAEDAIKDGEEYEVALTDSTVTILERWLEERANYPKYDDTDAIWLNRKGNRYTSDTLNYLLDNLCDAAEINRENRNISWYSIRHSVGTYLADEGGLSEAQTQLRHQSPRTTMKYANPSPEKRRKTLDNI